MDGMHQIGEVAQTTGLSLRTIRHWDAVGLVPPSGRSAGGFRLYTDDDVERIRLVMALKPLDLSLEEMREFLDTLDKLADTSTSNADRTRMQAYVATLSGLADERCERLREQLIGLENLTRWLRAEARNSRPADPVPDRR